MFTAAERTTSECAFVHQTDTDLCQPSNPYVSDVYHTVSDNWNCKNHCNTRYFTLPSGGLLSCRGVAFFRVHTFNLPQCTLMFAESGFQPCISHTHYQGGYSAIRSATEYYTRQCATGKFSLEKVKDWLSSLATI